MELNTSIGGLNVRQKQTYFDPISYDRRQLFQLINYASICGIISLFGIGSNIANVIVFVKQGFKDSINISLLGLAIADLVCSITMLYASVCYNPWLHNIRLSIVSVDVVYVSGGWPHVCFNRITSFITAFITLERCLCISMPLKVKTIITPFRTKVINVSIFVSMITMFAPFYFVNKLEWRYEVSRNKTILGLTFTSHREIVETITFFIHSVALSCIFLLSVTICTIVLVIKLNKKTKWRTTSVAQVTTTSNTITAKDRKIVKMIILISTIFIVCFVPPTVNFLVMVCFPEFSVNGKLQNIFFVSWSFAFVLEAINSSVNIVVYFNMSTKFKTTLFELFSTFKNSKLK